MPTAAGAAVSLCRCLLNPGLRRPLQVSGARGSLLALQGLALSPSASCVVSAGHDRRRGLDVLVACSAAAFDELDARGESPPDDSKQSTLWKLIQDIEPLDVSVIQKDVPPVTVDAMKRTISGMLGLLPSDQFRVSVEALWEPFFKLLVSSMMTGYTLHNAEYRLSFERNLETSDEEDSGMCGGGDAIWAVDRYESSLEGNAVEFSPEKDSSMSMSITEDCNDKNCLVESADTPSMTFEAKEYILRLQTRLNSVKKELHDLKRKNSALQMQHFVGEEQNDLLDYLRSLKTEKVVELSEPSYPGVQEAIHSIVHGLLATLSPRVLSNVPPLSDNSSSADTKATTGSAELAEDTSLHFQAVISVPRDYLARLLFWCMLLGHYIRGLEYRLELRDLLSISGKLGSLSHDIDSTS